MRILRKGTWSLTLFLCILLSCNKDDSDIKESTNINVNANEVLIDFVDINNHHLAKDGYANFYVVAGNDNIVNTCFVENEGKAYLKFKPVLFLDSIEKNRKKEVYKVYWKNKIVAMIESTFRLDSMRLTDTHRLFYYTNTENKVSSRLANHPIKMLVGENSSYREEELAKFCVVFNFPSVKIQPTEVVDYHVTISGFMGQSIGPIQKGLIVTGNPDNTQNVVLAIEGIVHNYYDAEGLLQEPYDIVYEIVSQQLFGNHEKHILRVTNSGDCYSNRIQACILDGQRLNLTSIVAQKTFGGEYINLTIK